MAEIRNIQRSNPISNFRQTGPTASSGFALLADTMDQAYELLLPAAIREQAAAGEALGRKIAGDQLGDMPAARYPSYNTGEASGDQSGLIGLVDKTESGGRYDTLYGHSQRKGGRFAGVDVTKMTLDEVAAFSDPSSNYGQWVKGQVGRVATPMGRFQIVGTTLRNAAKELGLSGSTKFDESTQDRLFTHLAGRRLKGPLSAAGKRAALRQEWEGFKHVSDGDLDAAIAKFQNGEGMAPSTSSDLTGADGADDLAEDAGADAISPRLTIMADADGKLTGKLFSPLSGPIMQAYSAAAQVAYQSEVLDRASLDLINISTDNALNPEGFAEASSNYIDQILDKAPTDLAPGLRQALQDTARKRYVGMVDEKHRDIRQRAVNSSGALMSRYSDAYAEAIVTGDKDAIAAARADLDGVLRARESLPGLSWTPQQSANEFIDAEDAASKVVKKAKEAQIKAWKDDLKLITDAAKAGQSASVEEILGNPAVAANHPELHAEAVSFTTLRDRMPEFQLLTPQEQAQAVAELRANPVDAGFEIDVADAADEARKANAKAWDEDAVKRAGEVLPQKPPALPTVIAGENMAATIDALSQRREYMNGLLEQGYFSQKRFFSEAERTGLQAILGKGADPQMKAMAAGAITAAFGADAGKALAELGADPVTVHVGGLLAVGGDPSVAQEAMLGQARLADNTVMLPSKATTINAVSAEISAAMPNLPAMESSVLETAKSIYAARAEGVDHTSDEAVKIMEGAVQSALGQRSTGRGILGGVQEVFGQPTLLAPNVSAEMAMAALNAPLASGRNGRGGSPKAARPELWQAAGNGTPSWNGADLSPAIIRAATLVPVVRGGLVQPNKYYMELNGAGGSQVQNEHGDLYIFDIQTLIDEAR